MKRYILNILLFFGIVAIVDFGVGIMGNSLQTHATSGETKRTNDLVLKDKHDVLILGSSRARHHYDTPFLSDTLGLDVYNAGYDGNGVVLSFGLLSLILERYHPQLVVFDVEPAFDIYEYQADDNHKRYIKVLKPYYSNNGVSRVIKDVSAQEWYKLHSGLVRYNSSLLTMSVDNIKKDPDDRLGFQPLQGEYAKEPSQSNHWENPDGFKIKYVENLLLLAKHNNIPIVVVASPKYGVNSSIELEPVKQLCLRYEVPFLDFYAEEEFQKNKRLFKEPMHLNEVGARNFSKSIVVRIKELLPSRIIHIKNEVR